MHKFVNCNRFINYLFLLKINIKYILKNIGLKDNFSNKFYKEFYYFYIMADIWIEKFRPSTFEEIKGQDKIVERIKAMVKDKNIPHLLFSGPAGVGKTSTVLVIVKTLFKDSWKQNFLDLNASDEKGIDIIRNEIKDFARTKAIGDVPFKIIHLDECDSLTREAQQALRRTMENYASSTRFCLSCNYSSKVIDPIQSRCTIFRFKPLEKKDIEKIIENIAKIEK